MRQRPAARCSASDSPTGPLSWSCRARLPRICPPRLGRYPRSVRSSRSNRGSGYEAMPQAPYGDAESLFRAAHNELMRVAYALLGNRFDTDQDGASWEALDEQVQARADLRLLWKAIGELPGMRRDVVALRAAGYEYREIAASLGVSISTVRSHISYARKQLSRTVARDWEGTQG